MTGAEAQPLIFRRFRHDKVKPCNKTKATRFAADYTKATLPGKLMWLACAAGFRRLQAGCGLLEVSVGEAVALDDFASLERERDHKRC